MKLLIIYHPNSEFGTPVESFAKDCEKHTNNKVETVSLETREGAALASNYGPLEYPAMLVVRDDGQIVKEWQGAAFPVVDEVVGYLNS